jgi:hypothetical protein
MNYVANKKDSLSSKQIKNRKQYHMRWGKGQTKEIKRKSWMLTLR